MMPATLTASRTVSDPGPVTVVSAASLSNQERAVALYASDMPTGFRYRKADDPMVEAWIVQGAVRLGLDELYRSAAYAYGYRLLSLSGVATPDQDRAHRARFPKGSRFGKAETTATMFTVGSKTAMTQAAKERTARPMVEGDCACSGTGWVGSLGDPDDPTTAAFTNCPGHNPNAYGCPLLPGVDG